MTGSPSKVWGCNAEMLTNGPCQTSWPSSEYIIGKLVSRMLSAGPRKRNPGSVWPILVTFKKGGWRALLLNDCNGHGAGLLDDFAEAAMHP